MTINTTDDEQTIMYLFKVAKALKTKGILTDVDISKESVTRENKNGKMI